MIELVNVTQHYGVRPVLKNIDLYIDPGELIVIVGPNGMGKTTLLGVMGGVLQPQHGQVFIDGKMRRISAEVELEIRKKAVYLPDQCWLPTLRTGREFLLSVGQLYEIEGERLMEHADRLIDLFDLMKQGDWPINSYSSGQKKKIALASALVTEAPILFLDEPFSGGLDPSGLLALTRVLKRRTADQGGTIVLTSPVPEIVEEIADRIIVLKNGEIAAFDTLAGLRDMTGSDGSLTDILELLMFPETTQKLQEYFKELPK